MRGPIGVSPGYSLIEMLVVLAIAGLVILVAAPAANQTIQRMTLSADARTVTTALRALRASALDRQTDIALSATDGGLAVSQGSAIALSSGTVVEVAQAGPDKRFVLRWDGRASGAIVIARGGSVLRIVSDRLTGRLSVETVR